MEARGDGEREKGGGVLVYFTLLYFTYVYIYM